MEMSGSSTDKKTCCCIDSVCYRLGSKMDASDCSSRGGTVVDNCHDCK